MHLLAKLRVSILAYGLLLFSLATATESAYAEVLISVNKSTQQNARLGGRDAPLSVCGFDWSCRIWNAERYLPSAAFGGLVVF